MTPVQRLQQQAQRLRTLANQHRTFAQDAADSDPEIIIGGLSELGDAIDDEATETQQVAQLLSEGKST